ncbi:MAG: 2-phospho-L-lactate guanylyltransferase [Anaerolineales bacterium]|nr:2-phospho-L-lactate guanylyltransferase [Anaerolineales bacterium]
MTLWAIVPVKPLRRSKSRLSEVLSGEERAALSQEMLIQTLEVLSHVPEVERILVISRDSRALAIAREHGARTIAERGIPQLNKALVRATVLARGYGVSAVLVLPADLPMITQASVEKLIASSSEPPVVVIAPDRHGKGTNALLTSPPGLIEYDFGPNSFGRHIARAEGVGARVVICELPSIELDLDLPEDLALFRAWRSQVLVPEAEE